MESEAGIRAQRSPLSGLLHELQAFHCKHCTNSTATLLATSTPRNPPNSSATQQPKRRTTPQELSSTELLSTELSAEDGVVTFMDLPERGGGSVEQTSLSALIGRGSHGSALSG